MKSMNLFPFFLRSCGSSCALLLAAFVPTLAFAAVNHRPTIGYVPDQRITSGSFAGQSVTVGDDITAVNSLNVTVTSSNTGWYAASNVVVSPTGASRTITFNSTPGTNGVTTITLTVTDGSGKSSASAFTLQKAASASGSVLQRVPNWTMPVNTGSPTLGYGPVAWVVKDNDAESSFGFSAASTNTTLVPVANVSVGGVNYGRTVTVTPAANQSGRATVTLTATDATGNMTSTAFVLDVVPGNTAVPAISSLETFHRQTLPDTAETVTFTASDSQTAAADLRVTAKSSNTALVPLSGIAHGGSGGSRNITVTPTASATGTATITLDISDGDITRQARFLYVVFDPADPINAFPRSNGVFALDGGTGTAYPSVPLEKTISLRDANISSGSHVSGFTLRVFWKNVEHEEDAGVYDFEIIRNALAQLPAGQVLSIILADGEPDDPGEPPYIAEGAATTWTHNSLTRAVPWDSYLLERRAALWEAMAGFEVDGIPLGIHPRVAVINPYLPGGHSGIRDPDPMEDVTLSSLPGYSRANLLAVVQEDLRNAQDYFPGKVVQIGFWKVLDSEDASYGGVAAWEYIRQQLLAEFDDSDRPRVGFFMENLAAARTLPDAVYTATPTTTFGQALYDSRNATWGGFQMLGSWTQPFNDGHVTNTLNGTPYDSMEYANKTYNARYFEVYSGDIANTELMPALQGWRDYLASVAAPAGLIALSASSSVIDVSWSAVAGATSYTLQRRMVGGTFSTVYTGATASFQDTGRSAGTEYAYRVRATTAAGDTGYSASFPATTFSVFPATPQNQDGWVLESGEDSDVGGSNNTTQSTLTIGDNSGDQLYKGILSFDTSGLPDGAIIMSAKLSLRRVGGAGTDPFGTHGTCQVDIANPYFGGALGIANSDYQVSASATNVASLASGGTGAGTWATATLNATGLTHINKTGSTQLRVFFADDNNDAGADTATYSSNNDGTTGNQPQLVIEYLP